MKRILAILPFLCYGCAEQVSGGGGGIETGNALAVQWVDSLGKPAIHADVRILPAGYRAQAGDTTTPGIAVRLKTDSMGWIRTTLPEGSFRFEASQGSTGAWWLWSSKDHDSLASIALQSKGVVHGKVLLPQGITRAWVRIPGRPSGTWSDAQGNYRLDALPPGQLDIEADFGVQSGKAQAELSAGSVLRLDIAPALESTQADTLYLDAASAGILNAVEAFPLLVRLDSSWFPFDQVGAGGQDLRIVADGKVLPMEIERWDAKNGKAEIWVLADIPARDSIPLQVVWGGNQTSLSRGSTVFRGEDGFQAVWHLDGVQDATENPSTIALSGTLPSEGIAGLARRFSSDSLRTAQVQWQGASSAFQWDVWTLPMSLGLSQDAFLSAGFAGPRLYRSGDEAGACFSLPAYDSLTATTSYPTVCSQRPLNDGFAHLITGQWSRDTLRLHVDGILQGVLAAKNVSLAAMPVILGRHPSGLGAFTGLLDEIRLQTRARSADWIRLAWATQRPGATLRQK